MKDGTDYKVYEHVSAGTIMLPRLLPPILCCLALFVQ